VPDLRRGLLQQRGGVRVSDLSGGVVWAQHRCLTLRALLRRHVWDGSWGDEGGRLHSVRRGLVHIPRGFVGVRYVCCRILWRTF